MTNKARQEAEAARPPVLTLEAAGWQYDGQPEPALRELTLSLAEGERLAVVGPGGSGKSTLCRLVCGMLAGDAGGAGPGRLSGRVRLRGIAQAGGYSALEAAGLIGSVSQDPETNLVMDVVEDELAFGPENLNVPAPEIESRIDRSLAAVGLPGSLRGSRTAGLSGGQQQRIAIAAALAMKPLLLVLDDAAANLDADGAATLRETLRALHRSGTALIEATPRWDGAAEADRVALLDGGRLVALGAPSVVLERHRATLQRLGCLPADDEPATSPRESDGGSVVLESRGLAYAYSAGGERNAVRVPDAVVRAGDIAAVVGPNGAGKTTFGKLAAGLLPAPDESLRLLGRPISAYAVNELARAVGYVFQRPERQFVADTVLEECAFGLRALRGSSVPHQDDTERALETLRVFGLYELRGVHPRALPVAEQRLLGAAAATLPEPALLVLDEPTAGLDYAAADRLMGHVAAFAARGGAALLITHDQHVLRRWTTCRIVFR